MNNQIILRFLKQIGLEVNKLRKQRSDWKPYQNVKQAANSELRTRFQANSVEK